MPNEFLECDTCRAKPGCPALCSGCLTNREVIMRQAKRIEELEKQPIQKAAEIFAGVKPTIREHYAAQGIELADREAVEQPEVIEGRGQAVTEEQQGFWIVENPDGSSAMCKMKPGQFFSVGRRYMKRPTFPPRPKFVAPPKPELVLFRPVSNDRQHPARYGMLLNGLIEQPCAEACIEWRMEDVELIDETTGEVKQ